MTNAMLQQDDIKPARLLVAIAMRMMPVVGGFSLDGSASSSVRSPMPPTAFSLPALAFQWGRWPASQTHSR